MKTFSFSLLAFSLTLFVFFLARTATDISKVETKIKHKELTKRKRGVSMTKMEKKKIELSSLSKLKEAIVEKDKTYFAHIKIKGVNELIKIEFFSKKVPYTVSNFIYLTNNGFYDGVVFHRVIPNFMAQGGDPTGTGRGGPGYQFNDEFVAELKNERGTISMANAGSNTNGSQFFINYVDNVHLNGHHTVFGKVIEGMQVVDNLKNGSTMEDVEIFYQ